MSAAESGEVRGSHQNLRDLGGLPAGDLRVAPGLIYRGDAPYSGDSSPTLSPWPPRTVIDLRSERERWEEHPLASAGSHVVHLPLARGLAAVVSPIGETTTAEGYLEVAYVEMVRRAAPMLDEIVELALTAEPPLLIHCVAGKDRTGIAVAVILAAAGVDAAAIEADYLATEANVAPLRRRLLEQVPVDDRPRYEERIKARLGRQSTSIGALHAALDEVIVGARARAELRARLLVPAPTGLAKYEYTE